MATRLRSCAKINLGLAIGCPRPDGFHPLTTLYHTIALHDVVTVSARPAPDTHIALTCNHPSVPTDRHNTAWRIIAAALQAIGRAAAVSIGIEKHLPLQGGLGAGSGNAAAALLALEAELALHGIAPLAADERLRIAAAVGSDIPLFLLGGAVLGLGRGEEVYPLPDAPPDTPPPHVVVAMPAVGVSTPQAFRDWDARHPQSPALTRENLGRTIAAAWLPIPAGNYAHLHPIARLAAQTPSNDFEAVVFAQNPLFAQIRDALAGASTPHAGHTLHVALSGSGASVFGLYTMPIAAAAAAERLRILGIASRQTRLVSRQEYWQTLSDPGIPTDASRL